MKQVELINTITFNGILQLQNQILAMETGGKKYVVSVSSGGVSMVRGEGRWNRWNQVADMIDELENDPRVKLFCFSSLTEFGKWLSR